MEEKRHIMGTRGIAKEALGNAYKRYKKGTEWAGFEDK